MGYHRAGFEVVGVDIEPQPNYPFEFIQSDFFEYVAEHGHEYDAIHASPPCEGYSRTRFLPWLRGKDHPMLIDPTRAVLNAMAKPWVIENVQDARLPAGFLCGGMFGQRFFFHRWFEVGEWFWLQPTHQKHRHILYPGRGLGNRLDAAHALKRLAWMTQKEQRKAIPPVYTEYIGKQLMAVVTA